MTRPWLSELACGAPECTGLVKCRCSRCDRPLCTWHHAHSPSEADPSELEPVCMPACEAEYWKGARVPEARPRLVIA